jgi:uncharacterized protein (TIGR03435 family)
MKKTKMMFSLYDGSYTARGVTLQSLIRMAYHIQDSQLSGGPDWLTTSLFDIDAKIDPATVAAFHARKSSDPVNFDDQEMLKRLLAEHFKLTLHPQTQTVPAYDLVVDASGSKLQQVDGIRMMHMERGVLSTSGTPIEFLAQQLSQRLGQTVIDKTGRKGNYAFDLRWTPDASEDQRFGHGGEEVMQVATIHSADSSEGQRMKLRAERAERMQSPDPNAPPLFTALQEQLGLRLESQTEPVQVLVIDHAEIPSQNP